MGDLIIRQIRRDELDPVAALHAKWGTAVTPAVLDWEYFDSDLTREGILVGAFDGDALVGTLGYIPYRGWWKDRAILTCKNESLLVSPDYRGRKVFDRMSAVGFDLCRQAGVDCIWGFTAAVKPFVMVGFDISGELFREILSWSPVTLYRAIRRGKRLTLNPQPWNNDTPVPVPRSRLGDFGLERDVPFVRHRYVNNPRRDIAYVDGATGTLFSYGGRHPFLLRISEVVDRGPLKAAVRRCKAHVGTDFLGVERFSNHPVFGWSTLPGSVYVRQKAPMRIVFKWLGSMERIPIPEFEIEEGYTEGVR
ncbi:MAG TPA: GNAT family N-acetyltransferase [Thermoanaerobaculia bacterium]|nr:GNAT family N-acetyltransferase [Thermoanaerobaculia bacterium]